MIQAKLVVAGDVHGVSYRAFCKQTALPLGLTGYAKNKRDGTVEVMVCGKEDAIAEFEKTLKTTTPGMARVDSVKLISKTACMQQAEGFRIISE